MKRVCWIIMICLLCAVVIFHQAILNFLAAASLQAYSISKLGQSLEYESLSVRGNQIVISKPRFKAESAFKAEHIAFNFNFNFWQRQLSIEIEMEHPHWDFESPVKWDKWVKELSHKGNWIKISPHFRMKEAMLSWKYAGFSNPHRLKFDLEIDNQQGGFIKLYFDIPGSADHCLVLQTSKGSQGVEIECYCEKFHCPSLIALAELLGFNISPWILNSGSLQGHIKAVFPKMQRPYLEGKVDLEDFVFQHIEKKIKGIIKYARIELQKNQLAYDVNDQIPTTMGRLYILKPSSLIYSSAIHSWTIDQIQGSFQVNDVETVLIDLQFQEGDVYHPSKWSLKGKADLNPKRSFYLDAILSCFSRERPQGKIHLTLNQLSHDLKHAKVDIKQLSYIGCGFLQSLFATYWPIFNEILLEDGDLNALVEADVTYEGIEELYIKQFEAFHLSSKVKTSKMACDFGKVRGYGKVCLGREDFWQSIQAGLHLEDGNIEFEDLSPSLPMTDIQAHVLIQQGHVEHSLITLQVAGLKGKMDVEWGEHKQLLTFKLDGIVEDIADLFPNILQEGLRKHFYHDRLILLANLKKQNQLIELDGTFHIHDENQGLMDMIHFGCELKKIQEDLEAKWIPVGWFHAQKLRLEKFLSPFIFRKGILQVSGDAEFKGSFDNRFLVIKYDANDLKIENKDLCIKVPEVHSPVPGQLAGSHKIDLKTYVYEGSLPIQSGTYLEKNTGLLFDGIQGIVEFQNELISIHPFEAFCEGVYFAGGLELDYRDPSPGVFDLKINCPNLSGKISQVQSLLDHFGSFSLFHKVPLEGDITSKGKGLELKLSFIPQDYQLQANIQGVITEGFLSFKEADMAVKGIYLDLNYNHQRQFLEFTDIQGTLLVGKPRRVEEYLFNGNHIHIYQLNHPNIDLDIAVKDRDHELFRLVGYTRDEKEGKVLNVNQSLSHLSSIYPSIWKCRLKDGFTLEEFEFCSHFDLQKLLQDFRRFRQTGFLFFSNNLIDKVCQYLPIEGHGCLNLCYHPDQTYTYQLEGMQIKCGNSPEHSAFLKGSKQDKKWMIDQLQWNDWNIFAEFHETPEKWKIPFLGLKIGQTLLLGLEGDWEQEEALLKAKLKFCEVDLSQLDRFDALQSFISKWQPKGNLTATGELEWDFFAAHPSESCKFSLSAEITDFVLRGYPFKIANPIHVALEPSHPICLKDLQIEFPFKGKAPRINVKRLEYEFAQNTVHSLEANFQIPHDQLKKVGEALQHVFHDVLDSFVQEVLVSVKEEGELKGEFKIQSENLGKKGLELYLENGCYVFKKQKYDLKDFQLNITQEEIGFSAFSQHGCYPFKILGKAKWPSCQQGECKLISWNSSEELVMLWEYSPQQKWRIRSLTGELAGCSFFLKEDQEPSHPGWLKLDGKIVLNFNHVSSLLPSAIGEMVQKLNMNSPYSFKGRYWFNPDAEGFLNALHFKGKVNGEKALLKDYEIDHFEADVQYVPGRLDVENLLIEDPAGSLKMPHGVAVLNQEKWGFVVPELTIRNLCPNLLKRTTQSENPISMNSKLRSLIVKRVECRNLKGEWGNIDSWQTEGSLQFLNASRKNIFHPLLAIPAEIILRLGLNPHVLNPVTGMIDFNLKEQKFYLSRFKDMYSAGRGSKFYLAPGVDPSWVDVKGNLSVKIRMKQYNLIFKIAELFTVSIQGNLNKPRYAFQKQSKSSRKGHLLPRVK